MYLSDVASKIEDGFFDFLEAATEPDHHGGDNPTHYTYKLPDIKYQVKQPTYYPETYDDQPAQWPQPDYQPHELDYDISHEPVHQPYQKEIRTNHDFSRPKMSPGSRKQEEFFSNLVTNYVADMQWDTLQLPKGRPTDLGKENWVDQYYGNDVYSEPNRRKYKRNKPKYVRRHRDQLTKDNSRPKSHDVFHASPADYSML